MTILKDEDFHNIHRSLILTEKDEVSVKKLKREGCPVKKCIEKLESKGLEKIPYIFYKEDGDRWALSFYTDPQRNIRLNQLLPFYRTK